MSDDPALKRVRHWWRTSIVDIEPDVIRLRGYPIEEILGNLSFSDVIWLMLRGEIPSPGQGALLEAALIAGVDHGPQAPSIAIARMAATCGIGLNGAMASAINVLGDVHGGAGEQFMDLLLALDRRVSSGEDSVDAAHAVIGACLDSVGFVPGLGHRVHRIDPRAPRLEALALEAAAAGTIDGRFVSHCRRLADDLARRKGKQLTVNVDGITATIYAELGFEPPLARGLFVIARSVGVLAHAWEQSQRDERIKGPTPPDFYFDYEGPAERAVPPRSAATDR